MKSIQLPRFKKVRARWCDLAVVIILASAIVLIALFTFHSFLVDLAALPIWVVGAGTAVLSAVSLRHGRGRWLAFFGLRHLFSYPPVWTASTTGLSIVLLTIGKVSAIRESLALSVEDSVPLIWLGMVSLAGTLLPFACVGALAPVLARRRQQSTMDPTSSASEATIASGALHGTFAQFESWLENDKPIANSDDDAFGYDRIAQRIAGRIVEDCPPAQAIVGRLGSGKSSIRTLVSNALDRNSGASSSVRMVSVEMWQFETPRAAVEGVIRALIDALAKDVSVSALLGLPTSYVAAMSAMGGFWAALAHLQWRATDPFDALQRFDLVAATIGCRYVVWVEDLERFAGSGGASVLETLEEAERLNPIRALLYGLDRLESVSVITATTSLHVRFDLEKIARYVEPIPALPAQQVADLIARVRRACREQYDIIDPADPKMRLAVGTLSDKMQRESNRAVLGSGVHDLGDALVALCSTPRTLKQALRSVMATWKELAGEIDHDDLLCMCILRVAQPDAFALIAQHIDGLCSSRSVHAVQGKRGDASRAWETAFSALQLDSQSREAIARIVEFVFNEQQSSQKPQGLYHVHPVDYWARFVTVPVLTEDERVQNVLRVLQSNDDGALVHLLEDEKRSAIVEQFFQRIPMERLRRLFALLVKGRGLEIASTWPSSDPPGLIPIWRIWRRQSSLGLMSPDVVFGELCAALDTAIPSNLWLAAHLEHYFASADPQPRMMGEDSRIRAIEISGYLQERVVATYQNKPAALADSLIGAQHQTLHWIFFGPDLSRAKTTKEEPCAAWLALAPTILEAARIRPAELLSQISHLTTIQSTAFDDNANVGQRFDFDAPWVASLFGTADAALDVFELQDATLWGDPNQVQAILRAVAVRHSGKASDSELV